MSSSQIRALLAAPDVEQANRDTVLFLNSKYFSYDDLEDLDAELQKSERTKAELESNLASSSSSVDALIKDARSSAHSHLDTAQNLSLLRHSLTDELVDLTQSLQSSTSSEHGTSTLLEDIETLHRNLNDLEGVKRYTQVIKHTLELSESAVQQIESIPPSVSISKTAVSQFQALQAFVSSVAESCSTVEDGAGSQTLHLVSFLVRIRDKTWAEIKKRLSQPLLHAAEQLRWPMAVDYAAARANERTAFEQAFVQLLQLQRVAESIEASDPESRTEKDGIYPLEALVQGVALRFKYHFEGTRQTNRPDKPEWYFTHVLNVAHDHRPFMESVVQQLLSSAAYGKINAWREFTRLLLPLLSTKLRRTIPSLLPHPSLLAHTIYQALSFDAALNEEGFELAGTTASDQLETWAGISEIILGKKEWFDAWLDGERRFAENQYHEIIAATDAWQIADDEPDEETVGPDLKTTNSARRVKALVEQVTDRYSPLPSFLHRTRFLVSTQVPLLDWYLARISASLDAYETLSSALVRAVPGALGVSLGVKEGSSVNVDTGRFTSGVEGVQRLCKAFLSSKYIEAAMEVWGEDIFFLELWTEVNQRPALRALARSNSSLPTPNASDDSSQDTIFEALIVKYGQLCQRTHDIIVQQVCAEIESSLRAHLSATTSPNPNLPEPDDLALSQTLLAPIALFSTHLAYLRATLPQQMLTTLYRRIASRLAEHLLQRQILYRGNFTLTEGKEINAECELWVETCRGALLQALGGSKNRVDAPWLKLIQAGRLVGADGEPRERVVNATFGGASDSEWEAVMIETLGASELGREEVGRILRRREM